MAEDEKTTTTDTETTDTENTEDTTTNEETDVEIPDNEFLDEEPVTTTTTEKKTKEKTQDADADDFTDNGTENTGLTREEVQSMIQGANAKTEQRMRKEAQVDQFLASDEGKQFRPYAKAIRANAGKTNLKPKALAYAIAGPSLMKLGAKMAQDAKNEADENSVSTAGGGGRSTAPEMSADKIRTMSKEDFAKMQTSVMTGRK